jgi:hypothetical protein
MVASVVEKLLAELVNPDGLIVQLTFTMRSLGGIHGSQSIV